MTTEAKTSLIGALIALTASLDGLCTDQDPEELSNTLRIAFKEPELYNMYISLLVVDEERAKALLGVFDKVCLGNAVYHFVKRFSILPHDTGSYSTGIRREDIQKVSSALWSSRFSPRFPHDTRKLHPNN